MKGNEATRSALEKKATRKLKRPHQDPLGRVSVKKPKLAVKSDPKGIKIPKHSSMYSERQALFNMLFMLSRDLAGAHLAIRNQRVS